jgi:hypothetical protein
MDSTRTPHSLHGVHKDIWGSVKYWSKVILEDPLWWAPEMMVVQPL